MSIKLKVFIISILGWGIGILVTIVVVALCFLSIIVDPVHRNLLSMIKMVWGKIITKIGVKELKVYGRENAKNKKGVIFTSNHQSMFDVYILSATTPPKTSFLSKKEVFYVPFIGILMKLQGCVFIDRNNKEKAKESLKEVAKKLKKGNNFILFPEGTRSKDGNLLPFKGGIFKILNEVEVPIIPVTIIGSHKIMKKGSFLLNRGSVIVVFDKPLPPPPKEATFEEKSIYLENLRNIIQKNIEKYREYN